MEVWKPINNYEGLYWVSNKGNVKNNKILLKQRVGNRGYLVVTLSKNDKKKEFRVHRLVGEAFLGELPKGYQTRHLDGDSLNNNLVNLKYGTHQDNTNDRGEHGNNLRGNKNHLSKLTEIEVIEIKKSFKNHSLSSLAKKYNVSYHTIHKIYKNINWKWLKVNTV